MFPFFYKNIITFFFEKVNGDPAGSRTRVTAVKGQCLNLLTTGPYIQGTIKNFSTPKKVNLIIKILLYVPLWNLVSLGRFELPVHWLKVSCVTSYATGSDILDGCFAANKHYHRLEEWIFVSCSTRQGTLMLTGRRVVYLCATSMHSSHYWRGMAHLVFPQIFGFLFFSYCLFGRANQALY